jgi:hypothetical protein
VNQTYTLHVPSLNLGEHQVRSALHQMSAAWAWIALVIGSVNVAVPFGSRLDPGLSVLEAFPNLVLAHPSWGDTGLFPTLLRRQRLLASIKLQIGCTPQRLLGLSGWYLLFSA